MSDTLRALLEPLDPTRVRKDHDGFSHLAAWDVRAHMNRIFGFGHWSAKVITMELVEETIDPLPVIPASRISVTYRASCVLTVNTDMWIAEYQEWAIGAARNHPWKARHDAHDMAVKTAASQAFKRCAINLGDQFGLSLYDDGSTEPVVREIVGVDAHADNVRVQEYLTAIRESADADTLRAVSHIIRLNTDLTEGELRVLRAAYSARLSEVTVQGDGE